MNDSSSRIEVYWVNPDTGTMVLQSTPTIQHGASLALNSHVGHNFEVRELPDEETGICGGDSNQCNINHFTVVEGDDNQSKYCV